MDDERSIHLNKLPGKTYVSRQLDLGRGTRFRIASKVVDSDAGYHFATVEDEVVLRVTPGGRQEVIAKFLEDDRGVFVLTLQRWNRQTGRPYEKTNFSFVRDEIDRLLEFLLNIKRMHFPDTGKVNITDAELRRATMSTEQARRVILENEELVVSLARNEVTTSDIVALGYRRKQLERFEQMLADRNTSEREWQAFFEANRWVFGYGLAYVSFSGVSDAKLEQVVQGATFATFGKRADALMKTQALISSLCFVEIKRHTTDLLRDGSPYRSGAWQPSAELTGSIAQSQATVHAALRNFASRIPLTDDEGNPTGEEVLNVEPRSFLVVGSLSEFHTEHGINEDKCRCFELFRRNVRQPEIITFDELFHRAKFIVGQEDG